MRVLRPIVQPATAFLGGTVSNDIHHREANNLRRRVEIGFLVCVIFLRLERLEGSNLLIHGRIVAKIEVGKAYATFIAAISGAMPMMLMTRLSL